MYGRDGDYWWADRLGESWRLLNEFPEIIVGRRAAITAFDSGPLRASDEEIALGWRQAGDVVITSVITSYDDVVGGVSDEFGELWIFGPDEVIPSFSDWDHLAGEMRVSLLPTRPSNIPTAQQRGIPNSCEQTANS